MRITAVFVVMMLSSAVPVAADGLISEPHALLYYQLPFSGDGPDTRAHFGLRMDRTEREAGQALAYGELLARPAVVDLRFSHAGMESFTLAGVDYLAQYRTLKADEEQKPEAGTAAEPAGEKEKVKTEDKAKSEEDKLTMDKVMHKFPIGYFIGAGIGVLLVVGAGS